jgi:hypothetical protein
MFDISGCNYSQFTAAIEYKRDITHSKGKVLIAYCYGYMPCEALPLIDMLH